MLKTIIVADEPNAGRRLLSAALSGAGYQVAEVNSGAEVMTVLKQRSIALIINALSPPERDALTLLKKTTANLDCDATKMLLLTTDEDERAVFNKMAESVDACVGKDAHLMRILGEVSKLI